MTDATRTLIGMIKTHGKSGTLPKYCTGNKKMNLLKQVRTFKVVTEYAI